MLRNPLEIIEHAHALQEELCDALERIADGLPDDVDRRLCARASANLRFDIPLHHRDEEEALFPRLRLYAQPADGLELILDRLASEHSSDTDLGSEIVEWLDHLAEGKRLGNPEMVGYMLRGFFESYRRHIYWENTLVIPVARKRFTAEDYAAIAQVMERNRAESA
jgi:hemerythrin-like domain-containing protein